MLDLRLDLRLVSILDHVLDNVLDNVLDSSLENVQRLQTLRTLPPNSRAPNTNKHTQ